MTVDGAVAGNREYNRRNGFSVPFKYNSRNTTDVLMHPRWMLGVLGRYIANGGMPERVNFPDELKGKITTAYGGTKETRSDSLSWDDLKALRDIWPGKLLVKGIMHPDDAVACLEAGADGVVVSNHGGRNLDAAMATIDALPGIGASKAAAILQYRTDHGAFASCDALDAVSGIGPSTLATLAPCCTVK